ncbi:MAG TPA: hypothetical protein VK582_02385 [Pyrinomonadaceae bacterium]|nr:hypothetical protein [Pyrinomonadaceae bacterium]
MRICIKKHLALLIFISWLACASLVIAQERASSSIPYGFSDKPRDCEINIIRIESLKKLASAESNRDNAVIAVARLGDGEFAQDLNHRRLANVMTVLTGNLGMKKERVVIASGERVRGYGRVEVYVGGQLVDALLVHRGKDLCVDCCDIDPRYYPYRKDKKR